MPRAGAVRVRPAALRSPPLVNYLRRAMRESKGNKTQASRLLGITHYQTLGAQRALALIRPTLMACDAGESFIGSA